MRLYRSRNKLLLCLLLGITALGLVTGVLSHQVAVNLIEMGGCSGGIALIVLLLMWRKKWGVFTSYLLTTGISGTTFLMMTSNPNFVTYVLVYLALICAALYDSYGPALLQGAIGIFITNYMYIVYQKGMFPVGSHVVSLIALIEVYCFVWAVLLVRTYLSRKQLHVLEQQSVEEAALRQKSDVLLGKVTETVGTLSAFTSEQNQNALMTAEIAETVSGSFAEIASGVAQQSENLNSIAEQISVIDGNAQRIADASVSMVGVTAQNSRITSSGRDSIQDLESKMSHVQDTVELTNQLTEKLQVKSRQIHGIVATILSFSDQSDLLALNAAVEASRAGQYGRGFGVVADEVKKLAVQSRFATQEISRIVDDLLASIAEVVGQVDKGKDAVSNCLQVSDQVQSLFHSIDQNSDQIQGQAEEISALIKELTASSGNVVSETASVSSVTEQASASVQAVLESVHQQSERIQNMREGLRNLSSMTDSLQILTGADRN